MPQKNNRNFDMPVSKLRLLLAPLPESDTIWRKGRGGKIQREIPPFFTPGKIEGQMILGVEHRSFVVQPRHLMRRGKMLIRLNVSR